MEMNRGSTLALTVNIGVAAGLEVNSHVTAFIRRTTHPRRRAPTDHSGGSSDDWLAAS
jgi:hypothetical protein